MKKTLIGLFICCAVMTAKEMTQNSKTDMGYLIMRNRGAFEQNVAAGALGTAAAIVGGQAGAKFGATVGWIGGSAGAFFGAVIGGAVGAG
ncbi:MAG: hypothetical protein K2U26_02630 [Cyclobacteriaceae bacterium]|nr:hypothetical protein [Cyclobacteriaceae bacterium]